MGAWREGILRTHATGIVDATNYDTITASRYFLWRRRQQAPFHSNVPWKKPFLCPKLTLVCHQQSHLIIAARVSHSPSQDYPGFRTVLREAAQIVHFEKVMADAAYDGESNHVLCHEELGIPSCIIPARRWKRRRRSAPKTQYRKQMHNHFPKRAYRQCNQVESVISRNKRQLGASVRARRWFTQKRECLLKVVAHNLMIVAASFHDKP